MTVVIVCGFWPHATAQVARNLLADNPGMRAAHYRGPRDSVPVGPTGGDLLVTLAESVEPDQIRAAWLEQANGAVPTVITAVPADLVLDGLTDETELRTVGLHQNDNDERSVGDLVARQIEQADTVLLDDALEFDDEWELEHLRTLLRRIAPWARHCGPGQAMLEATGTPRPTETLTRGLRGRPVGVHEPLPDHGVVACVFHARRPFHPGRLHDALDEVTDGVLRSRGHFWLASRPDLVLTWESAGGLSLGPVSGWLAELPAEHWSTVDPERCLAADIDWDPYYGDRHHHLAFIGIDLDPVRLHRILTACLLSDAELAEGETAWRLLPDPFRRAYVTTEERTS